MTVQKIYVDEMVKPDFSVFPDICEGILTIYGLLLIQHGALHVYNHAASRPIFVLQETFCTTLLLSKRLSYLHACINLPLHKR